MQLRCPALRLLISAAMLPLLPLATRAQPASADLAPTGTLRVVLFTLPIVAVRDAQTGEVSGVAADLGRELAARLGVPAMLTAAKSPAEAVDRVASGHADITFLVDLSARSAQIDFGPAYIGYETTFLVPGTLAIQSLNDVNIPGRRIIAPEKSAISAELGRSFKNVTVLGVPIAIGAADKVIDMLRSGEADGYTNLTHLLSITQRQLPGWRILPGSYMTTSFSIAYRKGHPTGAAFADRFIDEMKKNGFIQKAIERAKLRGAVVPK